MATSALEKNNREVLFTTRMTAAEAARVDELTQRLNEAVSVSGRKVTRSTITRMGIEMMLAQAAA